VVVFSHIDIDIQPPQYGGFTDRAYEQQQEYSLMFIAGPVLKTHFVATKNR
jgi:hypothetical protein